MKQIKLIIIGLFISLYASSDTVKVLFIGNSLTYYSDTPEIFRQLSERSGKDVLVDESLFGGATLAYHSTLWETSTKINSQKWDYVILQGSSFNVAFPERHYIIEPTIVTLINRIKENSSETKIIFFLDWTYRNGVTLWNVHYTYEDFQLMLMQGARQLSIKLGMMIAPIGWAWNTVVRNRPDIDLFDYDGSHPSYNGAYLNACVYYSIIFRETLDTGYSGTITYAAANYLQRIGSETVLNNLFLWNLPLSTSDIYSEGNNEIILSQNYPNPVKQSTRIDYEVFSESDIELSIFDALGRKVSEIVNNNHYPGKYSVNWETNTKNLQSAAGIYYIVLNSNNSRLVRKMIVSNK